MPSRVVTNNKKYINQLKDMIVEKDDELLELTYTNLGISKVHNVFFELAAEKYADGNKTELLRRFLNSLIRKNPEMFKEAIRIIKDGELSETNEGRSLPSNRNN